MFAIRSKLASAVGTTVPRLSGLPAGLLALAVLLSASSAAALCYRLPFGNPNLSDGFGSTCCGRTNPHRGVDFAQPVGTAIPAVANGTVRVKTYSSCLGNVVVLQHADGMYSGYSHMRDPSPLRIGQQVTIGTTVGRVGNTGTCTTGPHLHLTISDHESGWGSGTSVDPYRYIDRHGREPEMCNGEDDNCNGDVDDDYVCELEVIHESVTTYAPPTTTDVNGDGRVDVCAMLRDGFHCWPANGSGWDASWAPIDMRAPDGWNEEPNYATARMGDIDGDGFADLCARSDEGMVCATSDGAGFGDLRVWSTVPAIGNGWRRPEQYSTLRLADVNGDGRDDLCGRETEGFGCWLSDGTAFTTPFAGPGLSNDRGWDRPWRYGTIRMGDVNGDGRQDMCARARTGVTCWIAGAESFDSQWEGPGWAEDNGWDKLHRWSTIRLADFDGDGLMDLCGRTSGEYRCHRSMGTEFESGPTSVAPLANDTGWNSMNRLNTLRIGDVDGDGRQDIVARGGIDARAWVWGGDDFMRLEGPAWTSVDEWPNSAGRINSMRLADVDGDGREDICGRDGDGWRCSLDFESGEPYLTGDFLVRDDVQDHPRFWSTIQSGGSSCSRRAEECNGRDDNCDGVVDEGCADGDGGGVGGPDGGIAAGDAGGPGMGGEPAEPLDGGCGCRVAAPGGPGAGAVGGLLVLAGLILRRRRR